MEIKQYNTIKEFLKENLSFLEQTEAINNLLIGIPTSMLGAKENTDPIHLFSVSHQGEIICSLVQTPPKNFLIAAKETMSTAIFNHLIPVLIKNDIQAQGVISQQALAIEFAEIWEQQTGQTWKVNFQQLIYQLDALNPVKPTDGHFRKAKMDDLPILEEWCFNFMKEAMGHADKTAAKTLTKSKIEMGTLYVWENEALVSMAGVARPTQNGITVNYVYTPSEYRGKGYASNCVAAMSKLMLEQYKFCCLFTDMSNPTSNRIYQDMGYYPIAEFREIRFL